jgi:hypothetical protein
MTEDRDKKKGGGAFLQTFIGKNIKTAIKSI